MTFKNSYYLFLALAIGLLLSACQASVTPDPATTTNTSDPAGQTIKIGIISSNPADAIATFQPMVNYLAQELASEGFSKGRVIVTADAESMYDKLESGEVSLFFESPYGALTAYENAGAIPLVRRWKDGIEEYNTVIVVRKGSNISSLDELKGKIIAFEDPGSTSGYLLPRAYLEDTGFQLAEKSETSSPVESNEIGYYFTDDMDNSLALISRNLVAAAVFQGNDFENFPQEDKDNFFILAETPFVPRHLVMASPTLDSSLQEKIIEILLNMDGTEAGLALLLQTEETAKFDEFPLGPEGTMKALQDLFKTVR